MGSQPVVEARALRKRYGSREVVRGIDLEVARSECVGFLGPNGAGKTTTIRMLTCQVPLDGGEARVVGLEVEPRHHRAIKGRLGVVPQDDNLDPDLGVRLNLVVYASYFGIPRRDAERRADELLVQFALEDRAEARLDTLSGGLKRRLTIARGLVHRPELLVLDEPTTGLDPQARHLLWERLRELRSSGTTLLVTTHYMEEAAQLCDRVLVVDGGRIVAAGTPRELVRRHAGREVVELFAPLAADPVDAWASLATRVERARGKVIFFLDETRPAAALLAALGSREILHRPANLEDVFLRVTGRGLRD